MCFCGTKSPYILYIQQYVKRIYVCDKVPCNVSHGSTFAIFDRQTCICSRFPHPVLSVPPASQCPNTWRDTGITLFKYIKISDLSIDCFRVYFNHSVLLFDVNVKYCLYCGVHVKCSDRDAKVKYMDCGVKDKCVDCGVNVKCIDCGVKVKSVDCGWQVKW